MCKAEWIQLLVLIATATYCDSVCNGREPLNSGYPYSSQVRISVTRVNEGGASNLTKCTATAVTKFTLLTSAFCVENNSEGITIDISVYIGTKFPPRKTTEGKEWFIYTQVAMINMKAPLGLLNAQMATYGTWDEGNQPLWYPGFPGIICGWGEVLEDCCPAFRCSSFLRQTQCLDAKEYPSYLWCIHHTYTRGKFENPYRGDEGAGIFYRKNDNDTVNDYYLTGVYNRPVGFGDPTCGNTDTSIGTHISPEHSRWIRKLWKE